MMHLLLHAGRMFLRNLHRYRIVLGALIMVVAVLVFVLASVLGMRETLRGKASRYFAGDVVVLGYDGAGRSRIDAPEKVTEAVHAARETGGVDVRTVSRRSSFYRTGEISLFFQGYYTQQRRLVGVEWARERPVLSNFDFAAGGMPETGDENAALISSATAEQIDIAVGDPLLIAIPSLRGRSNTVELTVRGIFRESSFFGYTTYLHRKTLNRLKEVPEERVNEIGVYLETPDRTEERAGRILAAELEKRLPSFGVLTTREGYRDAANVNREEREYGVVTLSAQLAEITELLVAVSIIASVIVVLFLGIVVIGVSNTYSMIVYERTREIGTLRALGMQRPRLVSLFLLEALFLGAAGVIFGVALGFAALEVVQHGVDFPENAWSTLFFIGGELTYRITPQALGGVASLAVAASLIGAARASIRAGLTRPVDALRHG